MRISDWSSDVCSSDLTAAGEGDALLHDVGGQLGRRLVEGDLHRIGDGGHRLLHRLTDLLGGGDDRLGQARDEVRSEEHTSELQSLMRISYAVFCLQKKTNA